MRTISISPVEVIGKCPAGVNLGDKIDVVGMRLENPRGNSTCLLALTHFPPTIWQLQRESRFFGHASCPGCTSRLEQENRVVFLLGHSDKWSLCEIISEYLRLNRHVKEPAAAAKLKAEAIQHQERHEFAAAEHKMQAALAEFRLALAAPDWTPDGPCRGSAGAIEMAPNTRIERTGLGECF